MGVAAGVIGVHSARRPGVRPRRAPAHRPSPRDQRVRPGTDRLLHPRARRLHGRRGGRGGHRATRTCSLAHRPGFVAPTLAARKLATLDQLSGGRPRCTSSPGQRRRSGRRDGDFSDHDARYRRSDRIRRTSLRREVWSDAQPFDHDGEFYRVDHAISVDRPGKTARDPALRRRRLGCRDPRARPRIAHLMLWGEPLADTADFLERVRAAVAGAARRPRSRFSVSTPTDPRGDRRAPPGTGRGRSSPDPGADGAARPAYQPEPVASQRLLESAAAEPRCSDRCLWTPLAAGHGRAGQLHRSGRHPRDRRPGDGRLRRPRRDHPADPWLRAAGRRRGLRPRADRPSASSSPSASRARSTVTAGGRGTRRPRRCRAR